ncbi:lytic transglycosylase domain-containing protein [Pseudodonghicola flavimaris]|uniref:Lytic transglycosylase domain-containing protein n=1 Tax=Pseudodonghicola flavimaris TaxID=3050036 RepID=A0ABT7EXR2_9RHOB|nr:lytic transglycosylase domain-containing protein [Pseudodonghicola flavimaris]MDK3017119.1 lytic transglycosylase domain-containing protein [Pseudodonghicola flavimaris]
MSLRVTTRRLAGGLAVVALIGAAGLAGAEAPAPYADFQAKRVKPPAPGTKKRITVQIQPGDGPKPLAKPAPEQGDTRIAALPPSPGAAPGRYSWFWDHVSPEISGSGPGRLEGALQALSSTGAVAAPRLQALQDIARARGIQILRATVGTNVSPALVLAVISVESGGRADAVSGAGARGLMQLMPDTATRFGVSDSLEPGQNIQGGVKYLDWLMKKFGNDPILVLAGYNAGEGSVRDYAGVPPFAETRDYVPKVLAAFQVARGLCLTPPELISDGCVFAAMN